MQRNNHHSHNHPEFSLDDIFNNSGADDISQSPDIYISWKKHGAYKVYYNIKRFFTSPKPAKELNLLEQVSSLLNTVGDHPSEDVIEKCRHFIHLHRVTENTSARKRLERWAKRVIIFYLLIVLFLVVAGTNQFFKLVNISDTVMITILSTTTVNIIGLGLIVLRGHFYQKEKVSDTRSEDQEVSHT